MKIVTTRDLIVGKTYRFLDIKIKFTGMTRDNNVKFKCIEGDPYGNSGFIRFGYIETSWLYFDEDNATSFKFGR